MSENVIYLTVVTPSEIVLDREETSYVELPGRKGRFVLLEDHAPIITSLAPGRVVYRKGGEEMSIEVGSGFAEVHDNEVTVCVE